MFYLDSKEIHIDEKSDSQNSTKNNKGGLFGFLNFMK